MNFAYENLISWRVEFVSHLLYNACILKIASKVCFSCKIMSDYKMPYNIICWGQHHELVPLHEFTWNLEDFVPYL